MGSSYISAMCDISEPLAVWQDRIKGLDQSQMDDLLGFNLTWESLVSFAGERGDQSEESGFWDCFDDEADEATKARYHEHATLLLNRVFNIVYGNENTAELSHRHVNGGVMAVTAGECWGDGWPALDAIEVVDTVQEWFSDNAVK